MATVTVEVHGRPYAIGCADGQERRVELLARQFDDRVRKVAAEVGTVGDLRLFLMAALLLSDELHETRRKLEEGAPPAAPVSGSDGVAEALNAVAARIEKLAQSV